MNTMRNFVQLIGILGKDVDFREFGSGKKMARIILATNEFYKNKDGEKVKETNWHNLVAWGKSAEMMSEILKKGNEIAVNGKLVHRSYEDKDGNKRYISEVVVKEFVKIPKSKKAEKVEEIQEPAF